MLVIIICILMIIIGLIFMPSREEQNREKYRTKRKNIKILGMIQKVVLIV